MLTELPIRRWVPTEGLILVSVFPETLPIDFLPRILLARPNNPNEEVGRWAAGESARTAGGVRKLGRLQRETRGAHCIPRLLLPRVEGANR
jgi:hypothetical protein